MRKVLSYVFIVIGIAIIASSSIRYFMGMIHDKKDFEVNKSWWGEHNSKWGDLVNMAFLDDISKFHEPQSLTYQKPDDSCILKTDLYLWGDSYTEAIPDSAFTCIDSYHFGRNYFGELKYSLNARKRNILILESAERLALKYFISRDIYDKVGKSQVAVMGPGASNDAVAKTHYTLFGFSLHKDDIFNPNINQNIEYNLFNYNFLNRVRKFKANMNYSIFDRASGNVQLSDDGNYLFIAESNTSNGIFSYRRKLYEHEMNELIANINRIYEHYKKEGFAEIYLAIIPNPITMLEPEYYNQLIPRLRNDTSLKMPMIDLYSKFKREKEPASLYRMGDTHWNNKGLQMWLKLVNDTLRAQSRKLK